LRSWIVQTCGPFATPAVQRRLPEPEVGEAYIAHMEVAFRRIPEDARLTLSLRQLVPDRDALTVEDIGVLTDGPAAEVRILEEQAIALLMRAGGEFRVPRRRAGA
jgi:hypothetical protein